MNHPNPIPCPHPNSLRVSRGEPGGGGEAAPKDEIFLNFLREIILKREAIRIDLDHLLYKDKRRGLSHEQSSANSPLIQSLVKLLYQLHAHRRSCTDEPLMTIMGIDSLQAEALNPP